MKARRSFLGSIGADAGALVRRLVGRPRPVARVFAPDVSRSRAIAPRPMRVAAVHRDAVDAARIRLICTENNPVAFVPGQFVTVVVRIDGAEHRRAYSICSSASDDGSVSIACRRVPSGVVSTYLVDRLREGDSVAILGPSGSFTAPSMDGAASAHVVLVAGGSGITPLVAIARGLLEAAPRARVSLLYGNRAEAHVMLRDELDAMAVAHPERFAVRHVLEDPPAGWEGGTGRLDRGVFASELDRLLAAADVTAVDGWMLCGPEPMMQGALEELASRGVAAARIRQERFLPRATARAPRSAAPHPVVVHARGRRFELVAGPGQTLLEAALAAGAPMPFSCVVGGCGECRVRIASGRVEMDEPNCLLQAERAGGVVLACISRPSTALDVVVDQRGK